MKHFRKHNAGFTLVELIVAMAMATIVTAAATSVLLMGLRINRQTADTASQQITVRALLNVMEDAAAGGNISEVISVFPEGEEEKLGSWLVIGEDGQTVIFRYDPVHQTIYTNEIPVLEGVIASNVIMEGQLLSVSVETKTGVYTSAIYCRTAESVGNQEAPSIGESDGTNRGKFIDILKKEYRSRGEIKNGDGTYTYYSEWYIGGYENDARWNADTPWCACFVSWALNQIGVHGPAGYCPNDKSDHNHGNWFADVDEFMAYFKDATRAESTWEASVAHGGTHMPTVGDLIFFDWDKGENPEHVGVVIEVKEVDFGQGKTKTVIYTIEGNSAGRVTIRTYSMTDERIIGYGILPWKGSTP